MKGYSLDIPTFSFHKDTQNLIICQFTASLPPSLLTTRIPHGSIALATGFACIGSFQASIGEMDPWRWDRSHRGAASVFFFEKKMVCCLVGSWKIQKILRSCYLRLASCRWTCLQVASRKMPLELWKNDPEILLNGSCSPPKKRGKNAKKKSRFKWNHHLPSWRKLIFKSSRLTFPSFPFQHWPQHMGPQVVIDPRNIYKAILQMPQDLGEIQLKPKIRILSQFQLHYSALPLFHLQIFTVIYTV